MRTNRQAHLVRNLIGEDNEVPLEFCESFLWSDHCKSLTVSARDTQWIRSYELRPRCDYMEASHGLLPLDDPEPIRSHVRTYPGSNTTRGLRKTRSQECLPVAKGDLGEAFVVNVPKMFLISGDVLS